MNNTDSRIAAAADLAATAAALRAAMEDRPLTREDRDERAADARAIVISLQDTVTDIDTILSGLRAVSPLYARGLSRTSIEETPDALQTVLYDLGIDPTVRLR